MKLLEVKDTFNASNEPNKPYTAPRSKDKTNKLVVFIYQQSAVNYFVFDSSRQYRCRLYKKTRPIP
jgi:hypothetical protein